RVQNALLSRTPSVTDFALLSLPGKRTLPVMLSINVEMQCAMPNFSSNAAARPLRPATLCQLFLCGALVRLAPYSCD
ncbi:MAG TPA: hypothetical protein VM571_14845, partial [Noviherbaspirillum sp.]|nr:hypothetical protein [Noviherbaspirillum sp.]